MEMLLFQLYYCHGDLKSSRGRVLTRRCFQEQIEALVMFVTTAYTTLRASVVKSAK